MSEPKESDDEAIGRPHEWSEGRYEEPKKPAAPSPNETPDNADAQHEPESTPITRHDYE